MLFRSGHERFDLMLDGQELVFQPGALRLQSSAIVHTHTGQVSRARVDALPGVLRATVGIGAHWPGELTVPIPMSHAGRPACGNGCGLAEWL